MRITTGDGLDYWIDKDGEDGYYLMLGNYARALAWEDSATGLWSIGKYDHTMQDDSAMIEGLSEADAVRALFGLGLKVWGYFAPDDIESMAVASLFWWAWSDMPDPMQRLKAWAEGVYGRYVDVYIDGDGYHGSLGEGGECLLGESHEDLGYMIARMLVRHEILSAEQRYIN